MANKKGVSKTLLYILGGVVLVGVIVVSTGPRRHYAYIYPVKFVCGIMPSSTSTPYGSASPAFLGSVNPGRYTTAVNIQNSSREGATLTKEIMFAPREPAYGTTTASVTMVLPGNTATSADCPDIYGLLRYATSGPTYVEGFINVRSNKALHVVSVYTGQSLKPDGTPLEMSSVDIEYVPREDAQK